MILLFRAALRNRRHLALLMVTFASMLVFIIGSQLEMFSLKVLTSTSADFFELFHDRTEGAEKDRITYEQLQTRWEELDGEGKGYVVQKDVERHLADRIPTNLVDRAVFELDRHLNLRNDVMRLAYFLLFVAGFKAFSLFAQRFTTRLVAIRVSRDLRQQYFEHIQSLPMRFYQDYNIGSLSSRVVSDAVIIAEALNGFLINYVQTPFLVVSSMILCFMASWRLSLIIFLGFPALFIPIVLLARMVKRVAKQIQRNQEKFASVLIDFLAGIQTVKIFAMEDFSLRKYEEHNANMARLEAKGALYDTSTRPIIHGIATLFLAVTLLYGLYIDHMDVSQIIFFCGLLVALYEPVKRFAEMNAIVQRGVAAAERMYEVLDLKPDLQDAPDAEPLEGFKSKIEFKDVWFKYESEWILKGVSFTVEKGQTVAIVGPTGAGKSTIVQLIPRLYDPQKGEILIDGLPLNAYTQRSIREQIGFVPQKPFLFLDTIGENIRFGRTFAQEQVEAAAVRAHADEFIRRLPEGYDSHISEMGKNLSGGQQQRLAIARALVKSAPILIMDEATSSLDAVSENKIKTAIESLQGNVTQIIIAHRLSTIENADKIIFLDHGEKIAEGPRDELMAICPQFRAMWEMMHHGALRTPAQV